MNDKNNIAVKIENLSFSFGKKEVLKNINLEIESGIVLGIVGPNGSGKTTLLKIMLGLIQGYSGTVRIPCRYKVREKNHSHICIGYVPQRSFYNRDFPATVYDTVRMGLYGKVGLFGPTREQEEYIDWLLREVGIDHIKNYSIGEISGGQFQRALIARALVAKPSLLLLDEPVVGVDRAGINRFVKLILKLKETLNLTVILVSHDFQAVSLVADRIACLNVTLHVHENPHDQLLEDFIIGASCGYEAYLGYEQHEE